MLHYNIYLILNRKVSENLIEAIFPICSMRFMLGFATTS